MVDTEQLRRQALLSFAGKTLEECADEIDRLRAFIRWIEPHVIKAVGSYSMMDLNVFYGEARERIAALNHQQKATYKAGNSEDLPEGSAGTTIVNDGRPT